MRFLIFLMMAGAFSLTSCETQKFEDEIIQLKEQVDKQKTMMSKMRQSDDKFLFLGSKLQGIKARIKTNMGDIEVKFYPEKAPLHCFTFITRAEAGFYNNTKFHRVISGFMIQGGDPNSKTNNKDSYGSGGPIAMMPHEFNDTNHKRGVLSTARTSNVNAGAGSQFFIMHADYPSLNNQYTVFGEVSKGLEVVDKIASSKKDSKDRPLKPVIIKTIEVYK